MNGDGTEDECPSMPPMKGSINVRFPTDADSVGPFENIKIKSGSDAASDLKDVSTVDAGQTIQVSASAVKKAKDYQLEIYCAGKEDSTTFEPPFGMSMRLPPNTSKPTFDIERGMIPGGRSCDFRMIMGESNSGNPIGITLYQFNLTLKGGFGGGGGPIDNEFIVDSSNNKVCWDSSSMKVTSGSSCSGKTELFTTSINTGTPNTLGVTAASGGLTINSDVQRMMLASGKFVSGSGTGITVNTTTFCGHINGDDFKDPGECDSVPGIRITYFKFWFRTTFNSSLW